MKIYLVRHGESIVNEPDYARPLSEKGVKDIQSLAHFIAPLKLHVSYAYHSPRWRAKQTADILLSKMIVDNEIETRVELDALSPINEIYDEIMLLNKDIILVGHMPFMGKLAAKLVTGDENKDIVLFQPGCMVCIEKLGNYQGVIHWMLSPELFGNKS